MRNRYLDLLRAAAIVRVIVYHHFGWAWLSIVFPAMGVMFALAGSLTAASLTRRPAGSVVTSRLRRLLPPLWLLGVLAVPAMIGLGWAQEEDGAHPFTPWKLVFWVLPLGDPPGSELGIDVWEPLWYIRAYVWFILLSPLMWFVYKKMGGAGWLLALAPIAAIAFLDKTGLGLPEDADAVMWDLVTYGACWIVGFTHRDGRLARLSSGAVLGIVAVLGAAALYWQSGHQGEDAWDLNDVSESQSLWSLAFVLLVLRWQPDMTWLSRIRPLDRFVTLVNARAVTIYLWHNLAIVALWPVLTYVALDDVGRLEGPVSLAAAFLLTGVAVLLFGWAEDLAARRRPRLWPTSDGPVPAAEPAEPAGPVPAGWPEVARDGTPVNPVAVTHGPAAEKARGHAAEEAHRHAGEVVPGFMDTADMPVAGRPPGQHRPSRHPDTPEPIRFSNGHDDRT
ncbi:acyltransferase family protein [Actinoplanes sp. GCM10030250]|uniref:acyltransferase family protein n=1 Tax=Actinoplanes sp. GCM10030250 TaxID=3273376 RepID=UPI003608E85F